MLTFQYIYYIKNNGAKWITMMVKFAILCVSNTEIWIATSIKALFLFYFLLTSPLSTTLKFDKISANGQCRVVKKIKYR